MMLKPLRFIYHRRVFGYRYIKVGIDLTLHESDGGYMSLTNSPQADDKTEYTFLILHGMGYDGGIE
ncbi:hypothetical protein SDC9_198372 [bioreactor metagenome]|uniref:Uncharacterized protein n=1 Tax=bioreactor metagenome TaxID=1076179 RepID=A0A645IJU2_9ZZZZ